MTGLKGRARSGPMGRLTAFAGVAAVALLLLLAAAPPVEAHAAIPVSTWDRLAQCESGGNWSINTGNGYYGGLQFSLTTWRGVGGHGYPHLHSKAEQILRANILAGRYGFSPWPGCSRKLGLR